MQTKVRGVAHARAGLLGNPSDVYEGKAIAFSFEDFHAEVEIEPSDHFVILPGPSDSLEFPSLIEADQHFSATGCEDGLRLLRAATHQFATHCQSVGALRADDSRLRFSMRYTTDIPRQVGLAGSSAIVVAAMRALMRWFGETIEPAQLAELALAAELENLRIAAGPMDRVAQSYGGIIAMNFKEPRSAASYRRLDAEQLPPLFIAYDPLGGESSGRAHGDLRARLDAGDRHAIETIQTFPKLVDEGLSCLERADFERFRALVDRNFDTRDEIFWIGPRDRKMVALGRAAGAACKLCGSGGAIVGVPSDAGDLEGLALKYRDAGFAFLRPTLGPAFDRTGAEMRSDEA